MEVKIAFSSHKTGGGGVRLLSSNVPNTHLDVDECTSDVGVVMKGKSEVDVLKRRHYLNLSLNRLC